MVWVKIDDHFDEHPKWADAPGDSMFQFYRALTGEYTNIYMPVFMAAFGDECVDAIARLGVVRKAA